MFLLGLLLVFLGFIFWALAGLLPVLKLQHGPEGTTTVITELTWMSIVRLARQAISGVRGARLVRDPSRPDRVQVEVQVADAEGWRLLSRRPLGTNAPLARMVEIIDRFAKEPRAPDVTLPLRDRMNLMLGFALLFPLGTVSIFSGILLMWRGG